MTNVNTSLLHNSRAPGRTENSSYPSERERLGHVPPKDEDVLGLAVPRPQALGFQGALVGQQDPVAIFGTATHLQIHLFVTFSIAIIHKFEVGTKRSTWNSQGIKINANNELKTSHAI